VLAQTLYHLGEVARLREDAARAAAYYDESLALYTELGDKHQIALVRCSMGHLSHRQGNDMQPAALFIDSLRLCCDCGFQDDIAGCLIGLGWVLVAGGQPARAVRLLSAATQARPEWATQLLGGGEGLVPLQIASGDAPLFQLPELERNITAAR
jgi:hypothetical protein